MRNKKIGIIGDKEVIIIGGTAYLPGIQAAVTFGSKDIFEEPNTPVKIASSKKTYRGVVPWGADNILPTQIEEFASKNPIASRCLEFKIEVLFGGGPKPGIIDETGNFRKFTPQEKTGKYKEINDFFIENDIDRLYSEIITDLEWFNNSFVEIILNQDLPNNRKIIEISAKEASYSRLETANPETGLVENHFYSTKWPTPKETEYESTPLVWEKNTTTALERKIGRIPYPDGKVKDSKEFRYMLPLSMPSPGRKYYPLPYYYSIIKSGWLEFANNIPIYKQALMTNSLSIYYHVEISPTYFPRIFSEEGLKTKKEQLARIKQEFKNISDYLKGINKAGSSLFTYKRVEHGKSGEQIEVSEITIKVIDKEIGGEYIEDSHEASSMTFISMGVHPSLIGVIPGKTSSNLSGSDKRELLRIAQSLQMPKRTRILKPLYVVKKINKWPEEVVFNIADIILTTLDQGREVQQINVV